MAELQGKFRLFSQGSQAAAEFLSPSRHLPLDPPLGLCFELESRHSRFGSHLAFRGRVEALLAARS